VSYKTLILGGVRSGKSRLAERLARDSGLGVVYVATATAGDTEMHARIAAHRAKRPVHWGLIEEPLELGRTLADEAREGRLLLVECLTLWLTNLLCLDDAERLARERDALLQTLSDLPGSIVLVSNETNLGVIPASELARRFCDEAGQLNQAVAERCDSVVLTVAGLPQTLKGALQCVG
jgi:adenosylcobinamide kinase/adenosylcobinamide-phosphate guanylyltransferase